MATLILLRMPSFEASKDDSYVVEFVDDVATCMSTLDHGAAPFVVVIGPGVDDEERERAITATKHRNAYFLTTSAKDSSARIRRLVRLALRG